MEQAKTILLGPNEAGKTAVLEALQQINLPAGVKELDPLRDYPRKHYNAGIQSQKRDPSEIRFASARFRLETDDLTELADGLAATEYCCTRYLDDSFTHDIKGGPEVVVSNEEIRKDLARLAAHVDKSHADAEDVEGEQPPSAALDDIIREWQVGTTLIDQDCREELRSWLDSVIVLVDEGSSTEDARHTPLLEYTHAPEQRKSVLETLESRLPVFV
ncbi:MAG: hypothetical protein OXG43_06460 [Chloroflexi bacterium]|nr:hypothetical protein [Chloroflexota bacterium]